jgi:hypothetical protein
VLLDVHVPPSCVREYCELLAKTAANITLWRNENAACPCLDDLESVDFTEHLDQSFTNCLSALERFPSDEDIQLWGWRAVLAMVRLQEGAFTVIVLAESFEAASFRSTSHDGGSRGHRSTVFLAISMAVTSFGEPLRLRAVAAGLLEAALVALENASREGDGSCAHQRVSGWDAGSSGAFACPPFA